MGAFEENSYTNGYLAQAKQKMTTKGENSRISVDEAIPTVLNCTHKLELDSKRSLGGAAMGCSAQ